MYKNTQNIKKNSALQCSSKEGSKRLNDNSDEKKKRVVPKLRPGICIEMLE